MSALDRNRKDRRTDEDRRRVVDLDHIDSNPVELRSHKERRADAERRWDWIRVGTWVSMVAKALGIRKVRPPH